MGSSGSLSIVLTVASLFSVALVVADPVCPKKCICEDNFSLIECVGQNMTYLPRFPGEVIELNLKNNRLHNLIPGIFPDLPQLQQLDISANDVDGIDGTAFTGMNHLKIVLVDEHKIVVLWMGTFQNGLDQLEMLSLRRGHLANIMSGAFSGLTRLRTLSLEGNRLTQITSSMFKGLSSLQILDLKNNKIQYLEPGFLGEISNLRGLQLGRNRLDTVSVGVFSNMKNLTSHLKSLQLEHNRIENIEGYAFGGMAELGTLDLSNNKLRVLSKSQFIGVPNLQRLLLSHNRIKFLAKEVFAGAHDLFELFLDHNNISRVHRKAFMGLGNAKLLQDLRINLQQNSLTTLPGKVFRWFNWDNKNIQIQLEDNPWACDCNLRPFYRWLHSIPENMVNMRRKQSLLICNKPEMYSKYSLFFMAEIYLLCNN